MKSNLVPDKKYVGIFNLSDIFDRFFSLVIKRGLPALLIAVIVCLPALLIMGFGMMTLFDSLSEIDIHRLDNFSKDDIYPLLKGLPFLIFGGLLYLFSAILANTAIVRLLGQYVQGKKTTWWQSIKDVFSTKYPRAIAQTLYILLILLVLIGVPYAFVVFGIAIKSMTVVSIFAFILIVAAVLVTWLYISWSFGIYSIVLEDTKPLEGLKRSKYLVRGKWWRTFGIILLFGIAIQFVTSLLTTPMMFPFLYEYYSTMFQDITEGNFSGGSSEYLDDLFKLYSSMGGMLFLSTIFSGILQVTVQPIYLMIMYLDLRSRKENLHETFYEEDKDEISIRMEEEETKNEDDKL